MNRVRMKMCYFLRGILLLIFQVCCFPILPEVVGDTRVPATISTSANGTMWITVNSRKDHYYVLYRSQDLTERGDVAAMAVGNDAPLVLKDRFAPIPDQVFYQVHEISYEASDDLDQDGRLDYLELRPSLFAPDLPNGNAFNPLRDLRPGEGTYFLTRERFEELSVGPGSGGINRGLINRDLSGERFQKFVVFPNFESHAAVWFMNSNVHSSHGGFLRRMRELGYIGSEFAFHCELTRTFNGLGEDAYLFNFQQGDLPREQDIILTYQLLTHNMPVIDGNLFYRPWDTSLIEYRHDSALRAELEEAGVPIWIETDEEMAANEYTVLNSGITLGLLRVFDADEKPSILDVAIYKNLPNDVPLVRGIITETPQTPLSHVNLRAVQNGNPNAFIRNASTHPDIAPFIGKYVRFQANTKGYLLEEVTQEEVNEYLESIRPEDAQFPPRDLDRVQAIRSLEELGFADSDVIGAKAANVAELIVASGALEIPREVFPAIGYAVPFYFYDEFMKHNGFYEMARELLASEGFAEDPIIRDERLKAFRKKIRKGKMPQWMLDALAEIQEPFLDFEGIRCRSSTNNEDLPNFNGAGLYESYTHYPHEGHLSKSIRQVYASLWTFIAFEHREFYRVDHFTAAMGVLMHPNYNEERVNGVAVSIPALGFEEIRSYSSHANVQVGEDLVTNPEIGSRPEVWLLDLDYWRFKDDPQGRFVNGRRPFRVGNSNQVPIGETILSEEQATLLGKYLGEIVAHFRALYRGNENFDIEIEFKVDRDGQLVIKQARPWVN